MKDLSTCPALNGLSIFGLFSKESVPLPVTTLIDLSKENTSALSNVDFDVSQKIAQDLKNSIKFTDPGFSKKYRQFLREKFHKAWMKAREKSEFTKKLLDNFLARKIRIEISTVPIEKALAAFNAQKNCAYFDNSIISHRDELRGRNLDDLIIHEIAIHGSLSNLFTRDYLREHGVTEANIPLNMSNLATIYRHDPAAPYLPNDQEAKEKIRTGIEKGKEKINKLFHALSLRKEDRNAEQVEMINTFCNLLDSAPQAPKVLTIEQFEQLVNQHPEVTSVGAIVNIESADIRLYENTLNFRISNMQVLGIHHFHDAQNNHLVELEMELLTDVEDRARLQIEGMYSILSYYSESDPHYFSEMMAYIYQYVPEPIRQEIFTDLVRDFEQATEVRLEEYYQDNMYPDYLPKTDFKFSSI